jgi:palmitoyltransferase ZDHHC9/14/18
VKNLPTTTILSKLCCLICSSILTNCCSPFSQKNIQQCRCGTESCRGVLGPKPKKPVEDRSITSTIIAGTKRKLQDIMGSVRGKSEDNQKSPKKRKIYAANSALTKGKNADGQSEAARERAEKEAAEHSRQLASRQARALKRSTPVTSSRRAQSKLLRNNLSSIKSTRITTVSFQRKVPKAGALRAVKQPSHLRTVPRSAKVAPGGSRKPRLQGRPSTPTRSSVDQQSDSDEDNSPNITPASLRSASKKSALSSPAVRGRLSKVESMKSNPVQKRMLRTNSTGGSQIQRRAYKGASEESEKTSDDMEDLDRPAPSRSRSTSGR